MDIPSPITAGVDEAGRGPLAGPVVAAAVILPERFETLGSLAELNDSKKLSEKKRAVLESDIKAHCVYAIGIAEPAEIDAINILQASLRAMVRAVDGLHLQAEKILIDGNKVPAPLNDRASAIVGGDGLEPVISAASIIAKTHRDQLMYLADMRFSTYGFAGHKGYGAPVHKAALNDAGPTPIHRLSYRPVAEAREKFSQR